MLYNSVHRDTREVGLKCHGKQNSLFLTFYVGPRS